MFSLIIAIVAIALTVAIVAATMYHGGDTLTQGRDRADAAAFVSGAQQVAGAQVMHLALNGSQAADVAALVTAKDLNSAPAIAYTFDTANRIVSATATADQCKAINESGKQTVGAVDKAAATAKPYGCVDKTGETDIHTFYFKY